MHGLADALRMLNDELVVAGKVADQWTSAFRGVTHSHKSTRLLLPLRDLVGRTLNVGPAEQVLPDPFQKLGDQALRESLRSRYRQITVRVGCAPSGLRRQLAGLAYEAASFRVLIDPEDSFEVTGYGVLTTVALINGLHLLVQWKRDPKLGGADVKKLSRQVWSPLRLAESCLREWRPGDLWIADLAARTFREGVRAITRDFTHAPAMKLFGGLLLEFVTRSTLNKVLEAEELGKQLLPHAKFDRWPGLETIVNAEDAKSLRNVLATELVRQVAAHPEGCSAVAFLRLLGRLPQLPAEFAWGSRLLIAQILWELLECDPLVLKKLLASGRVATTIFDGLRFLREWKLIEPEPQHRRQWLRLRDVMACLESYEQFRNMQRLIDVARSVPTTANKAFVPANP